MEDKKPETPKSPLQVALESQFDALLERINGRFQEAGDQVSGLAKWLQVQLQIVTNKVRKAEITQSVMDVSFTAMLEALYSKGVLTEAEFKAKVDEVIKRKAADAPKTADAPKSDKK